MIMPVDLDLPKELTAVAAQFASVLRTNHVPTALELPPLLKYTSHLNSIHDDIQAELDSLVSQLDSLQEKRELLTTAAAPYDAFSSAFRRFPPELLQVIFVHCLPETRNAVLHAKEAPLTLGRVCRRWRSIVENTPELWATLHIVPPNVSITGILSPSDIVDAGGGGGADGGVNENGEEELGRAGPLTQEAHTRALNAARFAEKREIVSWWLSRSGTCPLSLSFVWFGSDGEEEMRLCASLLDMLLPMARRWRRLEFQVPVKMFEFTGRGGKDGGGFGDLKSEDVPLLRQFSLTDNRSTFSETELPFTWPSCLGFLNSAGCDAGGPRLSTLLLTFFSGGIRLPSIYFSLLRGLYLESNMGFFWATEHEMWDSLAECTALESLTLKFPLSAPGGGAPHNHTDMWGDDGGDDGAGGGERIGKQRRRRVRRVTTLPMLESFCLDGDQSLGGAFQVTRTLAGLRCPRLKVLEVFGRTTGTPLDADGGEGNGVGGASNVELEEAGDGDELTTLGRDDDSPLPLTSHEPIHGILHLLTQSDHPPLQKLTLESVNLVGRELTKCLRLVEATLEGLVVRDYAWRGSGGGIGIEAEKQKNKMSAEDMLLHDLIAKRCEQPPLGSSSSSTGPRTLCPNLTSFDASLSNAASQTLFCDFVESRYPYPPKGVKRLKHINCAFTAKAGAGVKKRAERLKKVGKARSTRSSDAAGADGGSDEEEVERVQNERDGGEEREKGEGGGEPLDIQITFHTPMPDEIIPSAWTGIEGV